MGEKRFKKIVEWDKETLFVSIFGLVCFLMGSSFGISFWGGAGFFFIYLAACCWLILGERKVYWK